MEKLDQSGVQNRGEVIFNLEGVPPMRQVVPLGLQHVVAAIVGVVTPALLVSNTCGLNGQDTTLLVQISLIITALATILQTFGFGIFGGRVPIVMGVSFAYVPTLLAIGGQFGLPVILGAQIAGGLVAIVIGLFVKQLRVLFPSTVTGTVIFTIGLSLYPIAIRYMAGGAGAPDFGSPRNWLVAIITLVTVISLNFFAKGILKLASILCGMLVGYAAAFSLNMIDFSPIVNAGWFQVSTPLHFPIRFVPAACISMSVMFIVNSVQTIGDVTSTTVGGLDREPTDRELRGGILCQGIMSVLGALVGGLPTASYSQNVGIITVNRVINRMVFGFACLVLLIAGFIPKFAAVLTTIPQCVIGGATVSVFATITMTGIRMITSKPLTFRNITVVGISVALGVGITTVPGCLAVAAQGTAAGAWEVFPSWVPTVFGSSSVVIAAISAILLNKVLPNDKPAES